MDDMIASRVVFVLLGKESNKGGVLELVKELLKDFVDVFPEELRKGLSPLRDI